MIKAFDYYIQKINSLNNQLITAFLTDNGIYREAAFVKCPVDPG